MEIVRTFEGKDKFWCACYPENDGWDILTILMSNWGDTEYLVDFLKRNYKDLASKYWNGITIDKAIQMIQEEAEYLNDKLLCIEFNMPGCTNVKVSDIFTTFNKHQLVINNAVEEAFIKGKIDSIPQMLRLYGIELEDGTIVISGGAIKLTSGMYTDHLKKERERLHELQDYLSQNGIKSIAELIQ